MNIVLNETTFENDDIKSRANIYEVMSPLSDVLEYDVFNFSVKAEDEDLLSAKFGDPVEIYDGQTLKETFYVKSVSLEDSVDNGEEFFKIECISLIGLLSKRPHYGDVYSSEQAGNIIDDILGNLPHTVDADVANITVSGWLPYVSDARQNLLQVLFATGASIFKTPAGIRIGFNVISDSVQLLPKDRTFRSSLYEKKEQADRIVVTEHEYLASSSTAEITIAETATNEDKFIRFDQPFHSLRAVGLTIEDSGANWAHISGIGVLYGKPYVHTMREITADVDPENNSGEGVTIAVNDKTLVSLLNAENIAQRLVNYYANAVVKRVQFVVEDEKTGDFIGFYDRKGNQLSGFIRSVDKTLTSFWRATADVVTDWTPSHLGNIYDSVDTITESGSWSAPYDYMPGSQVHIVIIGGATGGTAGANGNPGTEDTTGTVVGSFRVYAQGLGGAGGAGGQGGNGAMINQIDLASLSGQYAVVIGAGGLNGAIGDETTFDTESSEDGVLNVDGIVNLITGAYYCLPGDDGCNGGNGGDGGALSFKGGVNPEWIPYAGSPGAAVVEYLGGAAGTKLPAPNNALIYRQNTGAAGGGGGAANGQTGGDGNQTEFVVGGSGGAGASPTAQTQALNGQNGRGGDGGGGGGGAGQKAVLNSDPRGGYGRAGAGGTGTAGQQGGDGLVLVYYQSMADAGSPKISVEAPAGSALTVTDGTTTLTYTLGSSETAHLFDVTLGTWTVTGVLGADSKTETVVVDAGIVYIVTISYVLPTGYTLLNYIEGTGTQYIDTGVIPNTSYIKTSVTAKLISSTISGVVMMLGCVDMVGRWYLAYDSTQPNKLSIGWGGSSAYYFANISINTNWHEYIIETNASNYGVIVTIDGSQFYTSSVNGTRPAKSIKLMAYDASNNVVTPAPMKISRFKAYGGSSDKPLISDMYPCIRESDSAVGMYDIVRNQFYGNAGTGVFLYE